MSDRKDDASLKKIRKQESESLASQGAKLISFSPNGRYLLLITPQNELVLYKIPAGTSTKTNCKNFENSIRLTRTERPIEAKDPLGLYNRNISKIAWSTDSTMLACADLSGNIDAWMLANTQANGAAKPGQGNINGHGNDKSSVSEESDESEDEQLEASSSIDGLSWRLVQSKIPKVSSAPLMLSFRPGSVMTTAHDDTAIHTSSCDRLVIVTLQHEILEFHVRTGKLSDWSKRNPSSELPLDFSRIKDRIMGSVWDVSEQKQRIWLYGSSFLFMLDMNQDLAQAAHRRHLKRKRSTRNAGGRLFTGKKSNSGAGDRAFPFTDFGLAGQQHDESEIEGQFTEGSDDEDDEDEEDNMWQAQDGAPTESLDKSLLELRRQESGSLAQVVDASGEEKDISGLESTANEGISNKSPGDLPYWVTFKYRPILGIVALRTETQELAKDRDQNTTTSSSDLEVALVERPVWDLDLDLPFLS